MLPHRRTIFCAALAFGLPASASQATLQFQKVFLAEYVENHSDRAFAAHVQREAKCQVCHQGTKDRKNLNAYGQALAPLLDHRTDKKDTEKILAALRAVAETSADPSRPDSATFGEMILGGQLPAGKLQELKKEPAADGS